MEGPTITSEGLKTMTARARASPGRQSLGLTSFETPHATTLRRRTLTQPTQKTLKMLRGNILTEP